MPTFFFDIANHKLVQRDHQGRELASLDAARTAGDAELRNWIGDRRLNSGHWLEIRDSNGILLARLDPQPGFVLPLSESVSNDALATAPAQGDLLLAITALRRTLARLAAHGEDDVEDSEILEQLTAAYAERMAARISHAAFARS